MIFDLEVYKRLVREEIKARSAAVALEQQRELLDAETRSIDRQLRELQKRPYMSKASMYLNEFADAAFEEIAAEEMATCGLTTN